MYEGKTTTVEIKLKALLQALLQSLNCSHSIVGKIKMFISENIFCNFPPRPDFLVEHS